MSDFQKWSVLAFRAMDDAGRVLMTIEPESTSEGERLDRLKETIRELLTQALVLNGVVTRRQLDERFHFGKLDTDALNAQLARPEQGPVGEVLNERGEIDYISYVPPVGTHLYTAPPAAQPQQEPVLHKWAALFEDPNNDWQAGYESARRWVLEVGLQSIDTPPAAQRKPLTDEIVRLAGVALHEMPRPRTDWHSAAKLVCEAVVAHGIKEGT